MLPLYMVNFPLFNPRTSPGHVPGFFSPLDRPSLERKDNKAQQQRSSCAPSLVREDSVTGKWWFNRDLMVFNRDLYITIINGIS